MTTRRAFVRAAGGALVTAEALLAGCAPDASRHAGRDGPAGGGAAAGEAGSRPTDAGARPPLTRPILRAWADDIVWVATPADELPVAYVSMEERKVFVDYDYRDRAAWLLTAHISVSTALWRIPLPGDERGVPIPPGDTAREFEELSMRAWDPAMRPAMDDVRILRGRPARRVIDFRCVPLAGGVSPSLSAAVEARGVAGGTDEQVGPVESWLSAGPIATVVSSGTEEGTTREDFRTIGTGARFAARACSGRGDAVQLVSWARRG